MKEQLISIMERAIEAINLDDERLQVDAVSALHSGIQMLQESTDDPKTLHNMPKSPEAPKQREDQEEEPLQFVNYYECPENNGGCGHSWEDVYNCQVDDDCPKCGKRHISPYNSSDPPENY